MQALTEQFMRLSLFGGVGGVGKRKNPPCTIVQPKKLKQTLV